MRIGVIIPDRGDRPQLMQNCVRMMEAQTVSSNLDIEWVQTPADNKLDITRRYRIGYNNLIDQDIIFAIENDDYYAPDYIETMVNEWILADKPAIFGIDYTYYYHLKLKSYFKFAHPGRASMMNTAIKGGQAIQWPPDDERFLDMNLWKQLIGKTISLAKPISISMKGHGIGKHAGTGHNSQLARYTIPDNGFLKANMDEESFKFYNGLC